MPVDRQVFLRYQVLNSCFRNRYREYTIDDLVEECNKAMYREYDMLAGVSKRTIQNDIFNLQLPPYNIRLNEKLKRGRQRLYRYQDPNFTLPQYRMNDKERNKIQDAIHVLREFEGEPLYDWTRAFLMQVEGGLFNENTTPIVSFQTNPDLKGLHHFDKLLRAISTKRVLRLCYTPFGKETIYTKVYPYHLKQYNDRWYLIAQVVGYNGFANYSLDRIESFEEVAIPYKESDINFEEYFDDVVGVTIPSGEPIDINIKVLKDSAGFVLTKPIHLSQRVIERNDDCIIISINVKPNYELDSKILAFGPNMEVLSPITYRNHIFEKIQAMTQKYLNNANNLHT